MASEIIGLFTNPQQYLAAQDAAMQQQFAQRANLAPLQKASILAQQAGYRLGQGVGGALGGTDPQLDMISRRNALLSQLDQSDPESFMKVAQAAAQIGDNEFAMAIAQEGRKAASEYALIAQRTREKQGADPFEQLVRSGKYTPASLSKYQTSKNVADLELLDKTKDDVVVVGNALVSKTTGKPIYEGDKAEKYSDFARKLIEVGLTPGTEPFQKRMLEHINAVTKGASQGTGNVIIGGISVDTGAAAKAAGKVVGENVANIESQYSLQTGISDALKLIDKGIYAGAYGPEKGFVAKFTGIGDPKKVQNTEVFMANIGEIVIPRLQQFGGNDSNEELKYLQKVVAGDQRLEPESMKRILASAEKKIRNNIARLQKQAGGELPLQPMDVPTPSTPRATKRYNPQTQKVESITGE